MTNVDPSLAPTKTTCPYCGVGCGVLATPDGKGGAKPAERWDVGFRVRDVEEGPDGSLWMIADDEPGGLYRAVPK